MNPLWFGADKTGILSSTLAIQKSIDNNPLNKEIKLDEGNFKVENINLNSNSIISGHGSSTILTVSNTDNIFTLLTKTNVTVRNLSFKGNNSSTNILGGNGILVNNSSFVTIENCYFDGFGSALDTGASAIFITNISSDCSVINNYITGGMGKVQGCDINVYFSSGKILISGNRCYSNANSNGIFVNATEPKGNCIVTGNFCDNHMRHGIMCVYGGIDTYIGNSIISNNICTNNLSTGIYCNTNIHGFIITSNIIESCSGGGENGYGISGGISVLGNGSKIISNNYISNTGKTTAGVTRIIDPSTGDANDPTRCTAIRVGESNNTTVSNNIIRNSTGSGITVYLETLYANINNNQIDNCPKYGIYTEGTGIIGQTEIIISHNKINQSTSDGHGIFIVPNAVRENFQIFNNYIKGAKTNNEKFGINIQGQGIDGNIENNDIENFDYGLTSLAPAATELFGKSLFLNNNRIKQCANGILIISSANQYSFHSNTKFINNTLNINDPYGNATFIVAQNALPVPIVYLGFIPTVGLWVKGSRVINDNPTVGQPKSWTCTVTGTPGTWVSEGNL
jgi:hypothetical protein